jgi:threonine/homoserine efflux transporter RhtA
MIMTDLIPILAVNLPSYVSPAIALIAGILILMRPPLLARIVAIYLIIVGVIGLLG